MNFLVKSNLKLIKRWQVCSGRFALYLVLNINASNNAKYLIFVSINNIKYLAHIWRSQPMWEPQVPYAFIDFQPQHDGNVCEFVGEP